MKTTGSWEGQEAILTRKRTDGVYYFHIDGQLSLQIIEQPALTRHNAKSTKPLIEQCLRVLCQGFYFRFTTFSAYKF